ncbi:MAG: rhodanese-related sulfurtransferase [Pseudohongiellaceae bacterium]
MGIAATIVAGLVVLLWISGCRRELEAPPARDSAAPAEDASSQTAEPFAGWPEQLKDLVLSARDRFEAPSVFPVAGFEVPADAVIVDVRTAEEIAVSFIPGSRALSDDDLREAFLEEAHPGSVVVYCTAGWRSAEFSSSGATQGGLCGSDGPGRSSAGRGAQLFSSSKPATQL